MRVRLLGGPSGGGGSPRLWATPHATLIVQGWRTDIDSRVEIPQRLLGFLDPGTCIASPLTDTGVGTLTVTGDLVTDAEALAIMRIPAHETAVEVSMSQALERHP